MTQSVAETKAFLSLLERQARADDALTAIEAGIGRQTHGSYRWGRHDRRTAQFQPPHRSGDAAIWDSDDLMARRIRDQSRNEPQIKRIRDALEDLIVGGGVQTFADPFDPLMDLSALSDRDVLDGLITYALEADELFEEWFSDPAQFDISGKRSGPEVQRMLLGETVERGGCLLIRTAASGGNRLLPLAYQVCEYDELDHSHDRPAGPGINKIINGVELDSLGREVAFFVYDTHPFDDFSGAGQAGKSSRIRADRVIHTALFRRPSQSVGVSFLTAVAQPSFDRDKFVGSEITTAAKNALLLLVQKVKNFKSAANLGLLDDTDASDPYGNEEMKLGNSPVALRIPAEDEIELLECNRPTDSADSFLGILDRDIAGAAGLSYYTLSGNYGATSYSSVRAAKLDEDAHIRPLQNWFSSRVALPVRRDFHRQAIALGLLKSVSARDYLKNPRRFSRFDAIGAGRDLLDPEAESNAAAGLLRTCLTTLKQQCAKKGLHWLRVLRQIALENHVLDVLDIALDLSKGQGGQTVGNTRSKSDQEAARAAESAPNNAPARAAGRTRQGAKKEGAKK